MYKDVAEDSYYSLHPLKHYNVIGKFEGRDNGLNPSLEIFDAEGYRKLYEDKTKRKLQINPWVHYVLFGKLYNLRLN